MQTSKIPYSVKRREKYAQVSILREADRMLDIASAYSGMMKSEIILHLARCPRCNVLLLRDGEDVVRCPACGTRYKLEPQ
jgi:tRNA(Ile2) C34 agmatinyltransferase TiaS